MKPKSIALIIASHDSKESDDGDVDLGKPQYPSAFIPPDTGFPDLPEDWEGEVTFHCRIAYSDEHGTQLELMSASGLPSGGKPKMDRSELDKNFSDAEKAAE